MQHKTQREPERPTGWQRQTTKKIETVLHTHRQTGGQKIQQTDQSIHKYGKCIRIMETERTNSRER